MCKSGAVLTRFFIFLIFLCVPRMSNILFSKDKKIKSHLKQLQKLSNKNSLTSTLYNNIRKFLMDIYVGRLFALKWGRGDVS